MCNSVWVGSSTGTGGCEQPLPDNVVMQGDLDCNDKNDKELGVNETDDLVGQLVDYVSNLALLP